jgi:hypothetical protein
MSTRCQIEFRSGDQRRTVYRHWDGYPSAVIPDLLAFLDWSVRGNDVEYVSANFLYWSKRKMDEDSVQLGFGVCANDELHGDVGFYYIVAWEEQGVRITAHAIERETGEVRIGRTVASATFRADKGPPFTSFFKSGTDTPAVEGMRQLPKVRLNGIWYFRDDRLREFRRVDNPHERVTFDELSSPETCGRSA